MVWTLIYHFKTTVASATDVLTWCPEQVPEYNCACVLRIRMELTETLL